jgi:hypothetical protein
MTPPTQHHATRGRPRARPAARLTRRPRRLEAPLQPRPRPRDPRVAGAIRTRAHAVLPARRTLRLHARRALSAERGREGGAQ